MATIMAGILGLVAVIIRPAIDGLAKCIGEPIKRKFNYLCCFNDNVKDLEKQAKKLEDARYDVQSRVTTAQNDAQIVAPQVLSWLDDVTEIQTKKLEIDNEIPTKKGGCSTVGYSLSKKVKEMTEAMKELQESGSFATISHPPPPPAMVSINIRSTIEFDSRKQVEEEIMASMRDDETNKVGICGMGGVGKTTMAKTIMQRARDELGFEETVMAVVSQDVDIFKIQGNIAKSLGVTLSAEGDLSAHKLRMRLSAGTRRTLIVIDDVWEKVDLEGLGIPCNSRCKVLITSRNSHLLKTMDVEKLHEVHVLSKTEAWELFKSKAGSCTEQQNVVDVARQVVDECKGLPLALVTVGEALKDMENIHSWNTALRQLKSSNPKHMPEVLNFVYQPIRLSYDLLESDEQKSLFLLCCLFREDGDIPRVMLANMCMGLLYMNEDISSSRDTISFLIDKLISRFLLLCNSYTKHVKMHDVIRDVAIFIATEEMRIKSNDCTWISPNIGERIGAHGGSLLFPNLHLLWIDCNSRDKELEIHNDFFDGMRELKVIIIRCLPLHQLPETLGLLKNLRTLVLEGCSFESISVVGELVNLEVLKCHHCKTFRSLPVEIGRLSRLRLLEIIDCWNLYSIAPGVISNLVKLEELTVEHFGRWEARNVEGERMNASLCELEHLPNLALLKINIRDSQLAAEQLRLSPNMLKFYIRIGGYGVYTSYSSENTMILELSGDISWGKWIHECVKSVVCMHIDGDSSSVLDLQAALNLRRLYIKKCSTMKKLVTSCPLLEHLSLEEVSELEEIRHIHHNLSSNFNDLSFICIEECGRLHTLFSLSVKESGGCFPQLKELFIRNCGMMEQVFMWNEEEQNPTNIHIPLVFPKLEVIKLGGLPRLTSFIKGVQATEFPKLDVIVIKRCPLLKEFVRSGPPADDHHGDDNDPLHFSCDHPHKVKFGMLSRLEIEGVKNLCLQAPIDSFASLTELDVSGLDGAKSLFSFSMTENSCLSQLESLVINKCDMMEQVILWKGEENQMNTHITLLPKLDYLRVTFLPRLATIISKGNENIHFPLSADEISIAYCYLFSERCASQISNRCNGCRGHRSSWVERSRPMRLFDHRPL